MYGNDEIEEERVGLMVMWPDSSISTGRNATDLLFGLCGGWNPDTLPALRRVLARRSGIPIPRERESNAAFLRRLEAAGTIRIFDANRHLIDFRFPRNRDEQ